MTSPHPPPPSPLSGNPAGGGHPAGGSTVRTLLKHSSVYGIVPVVQRLLGILLIRVYTIKILEHEYGILELCELLLLVVPQLVGANVLGAMTRFFYEHEDERERAAVISSTTLVLGGVAWGVTAAAFLLREPLAAFLFTRGDLSRLPDAYVEYLVITLLIVPFSLSTRAGIQYLQIHHMSAASVGVQLAKTLVEIVLKLWMIFGLEWGVKGFLLSVLIGEALATATVTSAVLWRTGLRVVWRVFTPLLAYTLPLIPVGLCQLGLHQLDRLLLKYLGPDLLLAPGEPGTVADAWVGAYGFGYKIPFLLHTAVLTSFMQIWQPWVFGMRAGDERSREIVRIGTWALAALASVYWIAILFGRQAVDALAGSAGYREAWRVAPVVALAYLFYGAYSISQVTLFVAKRTWPLFWINLSCLALNVLANWILIPLHGTLGAALATVITFAALAGLGMWASHGAGQIPFRLGRALLLFGLAAAYTALVWSIDAWRDPLASVSSLLVVLGVKTLLGLCALGVLWRVVLDGDGRQGLTRLLGDLIARLRGEPGQRSA